MTSSLFSTSSPPSPFLHPPDPRFSSFPDEKLVLWRLLVILPRWGDVQARVGGVLCPRVMEAIVALKLEMDRRLPGTCMKCNDGVGMHYL